MLEDIKQAEMDEVEKYILSKLENQGWFVTAKKWGFINVQKYIDDFERQVRPLLLENGFLDVNSAKTLYSAKYPILNFITLPSMRLIDIAKKII